MIRVLLADDETMIRAGVRAILTTDPGIEVVAEAGDGHEAVELAREHRPDVVLLDIRMPRLDGLGAAEELRGTVPDAAVVMLTTFSEDTYIARALGSGVSGFLLKSGDPRELIAGVRAVAGGGAALSPPSPAGSSTPSAASGSPAPRRRGPASNRSPAASGRSSRSSARGCPTRRSRTACTSSRAPSRRT